MLLSVLRMLIMVSLTFSGAGDGGVAEAVIEDVLLAHDLGLLAAVLEHLAYVGANAAQSVCRFVKHAVCLL